MNELVIAIVGVAGTLLGVLVTFCACRAQIFPRLEAVFVIFGDWATGTITVTNTGDVNFSVKQILLDLDGDKRRIEVPTIENMSFEKFPQFLESGAALWFDIKPSTLEGKPINVKTRIVLQLTDGTRLFCNRRYFRDVE